MEIQQEGLSAIDAARLLGISERLFHELRRRNDFPLPAHLTPKTLRWDRSGLIAWLSAQPRAAAKSEPEQLTRGRVFKSGQQVGE
jgi:predicted DNA-binding transcriptional regulator AlpA